MATAEARPRRRRQIDVFSAGCVTCNRAIEEIAQFAATEGHELRIHDMHQEQVARRAEELGVRSVPAIAVTAAGQEAERGEFAPLRAKPRQRIRETGGEYQWPLSTWRLVPSTPIAVALRAPKTIGSAVADPARSATDIPHPLIGCHDEVCCAP